MQALARFVVARRWWVVGGWLPLAAAGGIGAPHAMGALSYDFGLPGQPGHETNERIVQHFGSGGANAPVLLVVGDGCAQVSVTSWVETSDLLADDGRTGGVLVYPVPLPGAEAYASALPALQAVAAQTGRQLGVRVVATGTDALAEGGGGGGADVPAETLFGGVGALVVLVLVFGSFLAVTSLLVVTRWREERGRAPTDAEALASAVVLLALAAPVLGLRLGSPTNDSLASIGGPAGTAVGAVERAGLGAGLTAPIEFVTVTTPCP